MYNSVLVTKLVNSIMLDGKKGVAQKVVYGAFDIIKEKTGNEPLDVFTQAMENIMPVLETKTRRVGGANYQSNSCLKQGKQPCQAFLIYIYYSKNLLAGTNAGTSPAKYL